MIISISPCLWYYFWTCHGLGRCPQCCTITLAQKCVPNALMTCSNSMQIPSRAHANLNLLTTPSPSPWQYHSITLRRSSFPQVTQTLAWPLKSSPAHVHILQRMRNRAGPSASAAWRIRVHRGGSAAHGCSVRSDWRWPTAFAVINAASARPRWGRSVSRQREAGHLRVILGRNNEEGLEDIDAPRPACDPVWNPHEFERDITAFRASFSVGLVQKHAWPSNFETSIPSVFPHRTTTHSPRP